MTRTVYIYIQFKRNKPSIWTLEVIVEREQLQESRWMHKLNEVTSAPPSQLLGRPQ